MTEQYDVIVVGSGLGGLSCGALFAKDGRRVLVLERHALVGGAATVFKRTDLQVEVGLHQWDGFDEGDPKGWIVDRLELRQALDLVPLEEFYRVSHPALGEDLVIPYDVDAALEVLSTRFPQHKAAFKKYFKTIKKLRAEVCTIMTNFHRKGWWLVNGPIFPLRFPTMLWVGSRTLGDFMDELFGNDELVKIVIGANIAYYSDNAHELAMQYYATAQAGFHIGGGCYVRGGSTALTDYLTACIEAAGGAVRTRRNVESFIVEGDRVVGVRHVKMSPAVTKKNGHGRPSKEPSEEARAPVVVGNAAPAILERMLPEPLQQKFSKKYERFELATPLWSVYFGLDAPLLQFGLTEHTRFILPSWVTAIQDRVVGARLLGASPDLKRLPPYSITNYDSLDSGLEKGGRKLLVLTGLDRTDNWEDLDPEQYEARKNEWIEALLDDLNRHYPGIREAVVHKEMATAKTTNRFLNTTTPYGYAQLPSQAGLHRPGPKSPVDGLWLASAFSRPGGGFTGVMLAGGACYQVAKTALKKQLRN